VLREGGGRAVRHSRRWPLQRTEYTRRIRSMSPSGCSLVRGYKRESAVAVGAAGIVIHQLHEARHWGGTRRQNASNGINCMMNGYTDTIYEIMATHNVTPVPFRREKG